MLNTAHSAEPDLTQRPHSEGKASLEVGYTKSDLFVEVEKTVVVHCKDDNTETRILGPVRGIDAKEFSSCPDTSSTMTTGFTPPPVGDSSSSSSTKETPQKI